jgi:hypothetical protein
MSLYAYYECSRCHEPYFAGQKSCQQGANAAEGFDASELVRFPFFRIESIFCASGSFCTFFFFFFFFAQNKVCGPCRGGSQITACNKHGNEWVIFVSIDILIVRALVVSSSLRRGIDRVQMQFLLLGVVVVLLGHDAFLQQLPHAPALRRLPQSKGTFHPMLDVKKLK